jgi:3-methyladenine DNA glycosylase/8-oxoguanine DNA glycosylase
VAEPDLRCRVELSAPLDLAATLGPLQRGAGDPTMSMGTRELWRATNTPEGPATLHLGLDADEGVLEASAWGEGAGWACRTVAALVGEEDRPQDFTALLDGLDAPGADLLRRLDRRHPGLRIPRSGAVVEATVPAVLEQKVIGLDAWASYRGLVTANGDPAPGPGSDDGGGKGGAGLRLPPRPSVLTRLPSAAFHHHGVERRRADTIRRVGEVAHRLDELAVGDAEIVRRLGSVPGVGPWTIAEVSRVALGDADAVSVGDFHLPHHVAFAFLGQPRGDDATMLELLEPYRPHRGRVTRFLMLGGPVPPRRGPRLSRRKTRVC